VRCVFGAFFLFLLYISVVSAQTKGDAVQNSHRPSSATTEKAVHPHSEYVGDSACLSCHKEDVESYLQTAHHLTSGWPNAKLITGKFTPGANVMKTSNPYLNYEMDETSAGYFQSAIEEISPPTKIVHKERIDVVVGAGRKGQTYLYWKGDRLFELPVTYWTSLSEWVNSPGYPDGTPRFDKAVLPRCLECHGTSFQWEPMPPNRYVKTSLVLGITCEKCHGPGREHVTDYKAKPPLMPVNRKDIINPATFTRDRQVDTCALCHAGTAQAVGPPLSFVPGEPIEQYLHIPYSGPEAKVDVHGNQVQLLKESKCYQSSSMSCTTCHNPHKTQRDAASYSPTCLSCHKPQDCGEHAKMGDKIANDCVDCHMPLQESEALTSETNGKEIKLLIRNHHIAIYSDTGQAQAAQTVKQ
jgi:hypothetical protein